VIILGFGAPPPAPADVASLGPVSLELAWGVAAVKRVASETLRGAALKGMKTGCRQFQGEVFSGRVKSDRRKLESRGRDGGKRRYQTPPC